MFSGYFSSFGLEDKTEELVNNPKIRLLLISEQFQNIFKGYFSNKNKTQEELLARMIFLFDQIHNKINHILMYAEDEKSLAIHKELIECKNEIGDIEFLLSDIYNVNYDMSLKDQTSNTLYGRIKPDRIC